MASGLCVPWAIMAPLGGNVFRDRRPSHAVFPAPSLSCILPPPPAPVLASLSSPPLSFHTALLLPAPPRFMCQLHPPFLFPSPPPNCKPPGVESIFNPSDVRGIESIANISEIQITQTPEGRTCSVIQVMNCKSDAMQSTCKNSIKLLLPAQQSPA